MDDWVAMAPDAAQQLQLTLFLSPSFYCFIKHILAARHYLNHFFVVLIPSDLYQFYFYSYFILIFLYHILYY